MTESVEPFNFSWSVSTKPPNFAGYKPTAHMVIDSRDTPSDLLAEIEDILYGNVAPARLPSADELIFLFNSYQAASFDAGYLTEPYFNGFDAGTTPTDPQTALISGGTP